MTLEDVVLLLEEAVGNKNRKLVFEEFIKIMIAKLRLSEVGIQ